MSIREVVIGRPEDVPRPARVALVMMPWARVEAPSIQCGVLKAVLTRAGHHADVHYLNVAFASVIGSKRYGALVEHGGSRNRLIGEWLWTRAAFGPLATASDGFFEQRGLIGELAKTETEESLSALHEEVIPAFLDTVMTDTNWGDYDLVGFSSTFDQNVASIALARRIKEHHPQVMTVFGGANVDGDMGAEYVRVLPWLDVAVRGEGERPIVELARASVSRGSLAEIPGVWSRVDGDVVSGGEPNLLATLDDQPTPDYDDYFTALDRHGRSTILHGRRPLLLIESSRGCWWGAKHHCTFCGLNALGMDYRRKSVDRVLAEMDELSQRHRSVVFEAVDNIIDHGSMDELCERLAAAPYDYEIFYEVKANLSREQLTALHAAGIRSIQPGIESLSTHVLGLMRKGSTQLINLRILKWATYLRMRVGWSILSGFPGETSADYQEQVALIPKIVHLSPPQGQGPIWMERFSPYFTEPDHGFSNLRPRPGYEHAYPIPGIDLSQIAYFFDYDVEGAGSTQDREPLAAAVTTWQERWADSGGRPILSYFRGPEWLRIVDSRGEATLKHELIGDEARVLEALVDSFRSRSALVRELGMSAPEVTEERLDSILATLINLDLVVEDGGHFFSLAMPVQRR